MNAEARFLVILPLTAPPVAEALGAYGSASHGTSSRHNQLAQTYE